eukprot:1287812-Rhodomonas_salina.1
MICRKPFRRYRRSHTLLLEYVFLLLLIGCGSQDPSVAERNSAADNVYPRSVTERSGWFRNWLELRARGYEEAMRIASEDMDTRENVDNLTPMDIWLLDWKLASERGKSAQTTSVDPEAWAQNYQCYLSRAKAVVQQMQNRIIIQNAMHYRELEQEIAK